MRQGTTWCRNSFCGTPTLLDSFLYFYTLSKLQTSMTWPMVVTSKFILSSIVCHMYILTKNDFLLQVTYVPHTPFSHFCGVPIPCHLSCVDNSLTVLEHIITVQLASPNSPIIICYVVTYAKIRFLRSNVHDSFVLL